MCCQGWLFAHECKAQMDVMHYQFLVDVVLCHWCCLVVSMDLLDWTLKWSRAHRLREIFPESQTNHWGCCRGCWFEWRNCVAKVRRRRKVILSLQTGRGQVERLTWVGLTGLLQSVRQPMDTAGCCMWRWLSSCEGLCCYKTCKTWATRFVLRLACLIMLDLNRSWLSLAWSMTSANGFLYAFWWLESQELRCLGYMCFSQIWYWLWFQPDE